MRLGTKLAWRNQERVWENGSSILKRCWGKGLIPALPPVLWILLALSERSK